MGLRLVLLAGTVLLSQIKNGLGCKVNAGLKPFAQFMEALRAGRWRDESDLSDFHELRQGFIPPIL